MRRTRYYDFLEGNWVERRYTDGRGTHKFKYIGVFVPGEPFFAVFYDDEKDDLVTEPVYAFVARVVFVSDVHYVEFLPVIVWSEGIMEAVSSDETSSYVGVIPARLYEKAHSVLLESARGLYKARTTTKQERIQSHEG